MAPDQLRILGSRDEDLQTASALLQDAQLVAFPTETVYGLGGDATSDRSVAAIFKAKGRPSFNPLIVHFPNREAAWSHVEVNPKAKMLGELYWPGPLTLVLPRKQSSNISLLASAGLDTIAVRVPAHPIAKRLLSMCERPLAAPSANRSGSISPTNSAHVASSLGNNISAVIDGGPCTIGLESTVVGFEGDQSILLRQGGITYEDIKAIIGPVMLASQDSEITSPGMLQRHYAPQSPIRLNANHVSSGDLVLGFGPVNDMDFPDGSLNLSESADLTEAAANLFAMMRALDGKNPRSIVVMPIPKHGLGAAINDRLNRACANNE